MTAAFIPAVLYAAKSTEDVHESIPTQLDDAREKCADEGWTIVGEYHDEGFSAYHGNRGPGLRDARAHAARAAADEHVVCMLVAQHSDRFSRGAGDKPGAAEALVEIWHAERRRNVHLRSVEDDHDLRDSASVANIGARNTADSKRKGSATAKGLARRKERGQPVGAIPDGYIPEPVMDGGQPVIDKRGRVVMRRVIDERRRPVIERVLAEIERGHTPGDIAASLNADGVRTAKDTLWTAQGVRRVAERDAYSGGGGYPPIIDADRHERIRAMLTRSDPVAVQARKGGRRGTGGYLLHGLAFCHCGAPLYTRRPRKTRTYVCGARRQGKGTCDAPPIPAERVERAVLDHLCGFVGDVETWIAERVAAANAERDAFAQSLDHQRGALRALSVRLDRLWDQHGRLVDQGDERAADAALRAVDRAEREAADLDATIAAATARLAEWPTAPDVDAALDWYRDLGDAVAGRIADTATVEETNAALRSVLECAQLRVRADGSLAGLFWLRDTGAGLPYRMASIGADDRLRFLRAFPGDTTVDDMARLVPEAEHPPEEDGIQIFHTIRWVDDPGAPMALLGHDIDPAAELAQKRS